MNDRRTRLAPSPTGALHLGNIFAFMLNWATARQQQWHITLRIEDIDGPRKKDGATEELINLLHWLEMNWDGEVAIQSNGIHAMRNTLDTLISKETAYHCSLSRKEIEDSPSAPHAIQQEIQPHYRPIDIREHNRNAPKVSTNWRFISTTDTYEFHDELHGTQSFKASNDFILWTKVDVPSYQLAVVCDDHTQGITDVIRGNDLLQSTAWQEQLYTTMGWKIPRWYHVPLILGSDGKRLAKRHGDSRISTYRKRNVPPDRIIGLIAKWACNLPNHVPMHAEDFLTMFDLHKTPTTNITFTPEDEQWLYE